MTTHFTRNDRELIYAVDKWTGYLWKNLLKESAVIRDDVARGARKLPTFSSFAREVFARLYSPPKRLAKTRPEDAWARTLHDALDELPAFKRLTAYCARNKDFASAATASLLEQIVDQLPDPPAPLSDPETRRKEVRGLLDFLNATREDDVAARERLEKAIQEAKRAGKEAVDAMNAFGAAVQPDELRQALRQPVDDAALEVEEITTASAGLSGLGGGTHVSDETQSALATTIKGSDMMKRLGILAGRMRRLAMGKRRSRTRAASSELSDVATGNDLARVLPHELMKLTDPLLVLDFLRGFVECSLLQYDLTGNEREGRGPLVALIDDSDSMEGAPATFARAAALALADLALADRRACRLVRFSHRINATIDLRPGRDQTGELIRFLSGSVDGGTNFEQPLNAARQAIDNERVYDRADVVLITDGEAELTDDFLGEWRRRSSRDGVTTYAIHIGARIPTVLRQLTPDVISLNALLPERLEEALFAKIVE